MLIFLNMDALISTSGTNSVSSNSKSKKEDKFGEFKGPGSDAEP